MQADNMNTVFCIQVFCTLQFIFVFLYFLLSGWFCNWDHWAQSSVISAFYPLAKGLHGHHHWWANQFPSFANISKQILLSSGEIFDPANSSQILLFLSSVILTIVIISTVTCSRGSSCWDISHRIDNQSKA